MNMPALEHVYNIKGVEISGARIQRVFKEYIKGNYDLIPTPWFITVGFS